MTRTFALHTINLGSIPSIPFSPLGLPGIISEYRSRGDTWALLGVVLTQTKTKYQDLILFRMLWVWRAPWAMSPSSVWFLKGDDNASQSHRTFVRIKSDNTWKTRMGQAYLFPGTILLAAQWLLGSRAPRWSEGSWGLASGTHKVYEWEFLLRHLDGY